jgi:hypothetical protein
MSLPLLAVNPVSHIKLDIYISFNSHHQAETQPYKSGTWLPIFSPGNNKTSSCPKLCLNLNPITLQIPSYSEYLYSLSLLLAPPLRHIIHTHTHTHTHTLPDPRYPFSNFPLIALLYFHNLNFMNLYYTQSFFYAHLFLSALTLP